MRLISGYRLTTAVTITLSSFLNLRTRKTALVRMKLLSFRKKLMSFRHRKYFFCEVFHKEAESQAAKDKRLTLLRVAEYSGDNLPVPVSFNFFQEKKSVAICW